MLAAEQHYERSANIPYNIEINSFNHVYVYFIYILSLVVVLEFVDSS